MPSLMQKKNKKKPSTTVSGNLGPRVRFLDVIQDACSRGGRFTLLAESKGLTYAVMVDRNGPFNVTGGGYTGSAALAMAADLRTGTYTMSEGWPELQPYYQLGLDTTLKSLLDGRSRSETEELPLPRGVDWIRNAEGHATAAQATAATEVAPGSTPPGRSQNPAWPGVETGPVAPPSATVGDTTMLAVHAIPAPAPPPVNRAKGTTAGTGTSSPGRNPDLSTVDLVSAISRREVLFAEPGLEDDDADLDSTVPGGSGTSKGQGLLKHLETRLLLWTIRMEEPDRFTLGQAWVLVGRSLQSDYGFVLRPVRREIILRWRFAREDWRKSGDVASKQKLRRRAPGYVAREK